MKNIEKKKYYSILYFLFKNTRGGMQRKDKAVSSVYDPSRKRYIETFFFDKIGKYCVKETFLTTDLVPHAHGTLLYGASPTVIDSKITQKWFKNPFDAAYYFATLVNRVDEIKEKYFDYKNHPEHAEKVSGFEKYFK
jgi:hypothetical protein